MALGEKLTNLRKAKGLSQEQLAEELNLTRQTISKWELNQSAPDIDYLLQLSNFFGVTTDYLIKGKQPEDIQETNSNLYGIDHLESKPSNLNKWSFYLGSIGIGVSLVGIIAFMICSALKPHTATVNGMVFKGILGFLYGSNTLWFFIVLLVLFIAGCLLAVYGIAKNKRPKK